MFQCGNLYDRDLSEPAIGDIRTNAQAASPTVKGSHPSFGPTKKKTQVLSPTAWKLLRLCHKKCLCHKKLSAYAKKQKTEPFAISQSICTRTLRNLTRYLHQAFSPPKTSGTSQGLCTGTFRNLTRYSICSGTLRNLTTHLHLDPPEPHQEAAPETSGTSPGTYAKTL